MALPTLLLIALPSLPFPWKPHWPDWVERWMYNPRERVERSLDAQKQGKPREAVGPADTALRLAPDDPLVQYDAGTASYTRDGNLLGHIALGLILVRETATGIAGFPVELRSNLEHLVLSHHGSREHGSPNEPKTLEAFIVATVDELDAKIHQVRRAIREDAGDGEFTAWHKRLGRVLYKGPAGA